jgi:hypothetical protein
VKRVLEPEGMRGNSLVHHLPDPAVFWREVCRVVRRGAAVHVMDLVRPDSTERARAIVEGAAGDADPILKRASAFAATS